jgi:hypothetical protein
MTDSETHNPSPFTESNVSSIGGRGKGNSPATIHKIRTQLADNAPQLQQYIDMGFTPTNLSSILSKSKQSIDVALTGDTEHFGLCNQEVIDAVRDHLVSKDVRGEHAVFLPSNISSMLHGAGKDAGNALKELASVVKDEPESLKALFNTFDKKSVSSMLAGAGKDVSNALKELASAVRDEPESLKALFDTFDKKSVSSMLDGAGKDAGNALKELESVVKDEPESLQALFNTFDKKSVSSILHGAGKDTGNALKELASVVKDEPESLQALFNTFDKKSVSSILHGAGKDTGNALKELARVVKDEPESLKALLDTFDKKSVSSMLAGAGKDAGNALKELANIVKDKPESLNVLLETFTPKNISSMLNGAGVHTGTALKELANEKTLHKLEGVLELKGTQGKMTPDNLACILDSSGKNIVRNIDVLIARKEHIETIFDTMQPSQFGTALENISHSKLGSAVDKLAKEARQGVTVAAGTDVEIAGQSPATQSHTRGIV